MANHGVTEGGDSGGGRKEAAITAYSQSITYKVCSLLMPDMVEGMEPVRGFCIRTLQQG